MSQWTFTRDRDGDLINLHKIECIAVRVWELLSEDNPKQHSHYVSAESEGEVEYILFSGTYDECVEHREHVAKFLEIH